MKNFRCFVLLMFELLSNEKTEDHVKYEFKLG